MLVYWIDAWLFGWLIALVVALLGCLPVACELLSIFVASRLLGGDSLVALPDGFEVPQPMVIWAKSATENNMHGMCELVS